MGESESESELESEFWESPRSGLEQTVFPFSAVPLSEGVGGVRSPSRSRSPVLSRKGTTFFRDRQKLGRLL